MYLILLVSLVSIFSSLTDLRKFFVFSELVWLVIFFLCVVLGGLTNMPALYAQALFVLIFTACEVIILSSLLLLGFENNRGLFNGSTLL